MGRPPQASSQVSAGLGILVQLDLRRDQDGGLDLHHREFGELDAHGRGEGAQARADLGDRPLELGVGGMQLDAGQFIDKLALTDGAAFTTEKQAKTSVDETIEPGQSFIPFGAPLIGEDEIEEVTATLRSGWIGTRVIRRPKVSTTYTALPSGATCTMRPLPGPPFRSATKIVPLGSTATPVGCCKVSVISSVMRVAGSKRKSPRPRLSPR